MGTGIIQPSFASGEVSPALYGRVDYARYYNGLRTCRNFIVRPFGGVCNRPGTRFVAELHDEAYSARLVPFTFSLEQTYLLEFGHHYVRIIKDGALVVAGSPAVPVVVTTPYVAADLAQLNSCQSNDVLYLVHPNYPPQMLSRTSHTAWTLTGLATTHGPFKDINIDESIALVCSAVTGTITVTASTDFFTSDHVGLQLYLEQSPEDSTPRWAVEMSVSTGFIVKAGANYYQAVEGGVTGTVRPTTVEGTECDGPMTSNGLSIIGVKWLYLHSGSGVIRIDEVIDSATATATVVNRLPDACTTGGTLHWISDVVTGAAYDAGPPEVLATQATVTAIGHGLVTGDVASISSVLGATEANGTHSVTVIDSSTFTLDDVTLTSIYTGGGSVRKTSNGQPSFKWAWQAWSPTDGYPGAVGFHQQRLCFGGSLSQPNTIWMSRIAGYYDFGKSVPVLDDDAITISIFSRTVNQVRHFVTLSELEVLTSGGPAIIRGGSDNVITPSKISARFQCEAGCSLLPPVVIGAQALYYQNKGQQIRAITRNNLDEPIVADDVTLVSRHLLERHTLTDWAYQDAPFGALWSVREDGALLCLTYLPTQEVVGWSRHDTDGVYEAVGSVTEGEADTLYAVVRRTVGGVTRRYLERFDDRQFVTLKDAWFVDCGLQYDGRNTGATTMTLSGGTLWDYTETLTLTASVPTFSTADIGDVITLPDSATGGEYRLTIVGCSSGLVVTVNPNKTIASSVRGVAQTSWSFARNVISGLSHLEGKSVSILADGFVVSPRTVSGGRITLDTPAAVVTVGLPIVADLETLDLSISNQNIRDKQKQINHVSLVTEESHSVWLGPDVNHLTEVKQRNAEYYDLSPSALNGFTESRVLTAWSKTARVVVRQADPLPITILALVPEVNVGGS